MYPKSLMQRAVFTSSLLVLGLSLMGTKACQEDYFFAARATVITTATVTATETPEDEEVITATPTATAESSGTGTPATETPTPTATAEATVSAAAQAGVTGRPPGSAVLPLLQELESASEEEGETTQPQLANQGAAGAHPESGGNWLGNMYSNKDEAAGVAKDKADESDADGDGYVTWIEKSAGTDPRNAQSSPPPPVTSLSARLMGSDDDGDGLSNQEEERRGTNISVADSDGDGIADGAEVLSDSDPLNAESRPLDTDGDGLSDAYERSVGISPVVRDTDGDGLDDNREVALGTSAVERDSDGDGILDGREIEVGSDPLTAEPNLSSFSR